MEIWHTGGLDHVVVSVCCLMTSWHRALILFNICSQYTSTLNGTSNVTCQRKERISGLWHPVIEILSPSLNCLLL